MELSDIKQIIEDNRQNAEIVDASFLERKTRFFTERYIKMEDRNQYSTTYDVNISDRINNEEGNVNFINATSYPFKINELIESIYTELSRIFKAENQYIDFFLKNGETIQTDLKPLEKDLWERLKLFPNSIAVIHQNEEGEAITEYIHIDSVIHVDFKDETIFNVIYQQCKDTVIVVTQSEFIIVTLKNNIPISEERFIHGLDYCPAIFISPLRVNSSTEILRSNPITNSLGWIEELQTMYVMKNILSPHAFMQFIKRYGNKGCEYEQGAIYCDNGILKNKETNSYLVSANGLRKCPACNKSIGIGNEILAPIPNNSGETDLIVNAVGFVSPDSAIMSYGDEFLAGFEDKVYAQIVGVNEKLNPDLNHNEIAYKFNIESQQNVLERWSNVLELSIKFIKDTEYKYQFGEQYFGSVVELGDDFLLSSIDALYEEKQKAKDLGLSEVLNFNGRIINVQYSTNPIEKRRATIIDAFKPFDQSITEVETSYRNKLIQRKDYIKTKYLHNFIEYFEANNINLFEFADDVSMDKVLKILNESFDKYYNEFKLNEDDRAKSTATEGS